MGRTCTICTHPQRARIDSAIVTGTSYRAIARQFHVDDNAVQRHAAEHISDAVRDHQEAREEAQALDVVKQLRAINGVALDVLNKAREAGNHTLTLKAIDRVHRQIELQARLLGDLDERPQITLVITPEWLTFRTTLLQALAPYAEARIAAAAALQEAEEHGLEQGAAHGIVDSE